MQSLSYPAAKLSTLVFGACANAKGAAPARNIRLQALQRQSDLISSKGDQCKDPASKRMDDQVRQVIAAGSDPESPAVRSVFEGNRAIEQCRQKEARAQAQLAARERTEYLREAKPCAAAYL
jgi:hypothetical protein